MGLVAFMLGGVAACPVWARCALLLMLARFRRKRASAAWMTKRAETLTDAA